MADESELLTILREIRDAQRAHHERYVEFSEAALKRQAEAAERSKAAQERASAAAERARAAAGGARTRDFAMWVGLGLQAALVVVVIIALLYR